MRWRPHWGWPTARGCEATCRLLRRLLHAVRHCPRPGCYMLPVDLCRTTGAPWRGQADHVCTSFPKPQGEMNEGWVKVEAWMALCRAAHFSPWLPCACPTQLACCRKRGNDQGIIAHWVGTQACPQCMSSALRLCILGMHHPKQGISPGMNKVGLAWQAQRFHGAVVHRQHTTQPAQVTSPSSNDHSAHTEQPGWRRAALGLCCRQSWRHGEACAS